MPIVILPPDLHAAEVTQASYTTQYKSDEVSPVHEQLNNGTVSADDVEFYRDCQNQLHLTFASKRRLALLADHAVKRNSTIKIETLVDDKVSSYTKAWERELRIVDTLKHYGVPPRLIQKYITIRA